mmetsp:Transcript_7499/g.15581  ORF Transcript_7499/g.15581 Transcript_7499/m.15581 type:complete len:269 (-) Transcript_7499:660-1466(-)
MAEFLASSICDWAFSTFEQAVCRPCRSPAASFSAARAVLTAFTASGWAARSSSFLLFPSASALSASARAASAAAKSPSHSSRSPRRASSSLEAAACSLSASSSHHKVSASAIAAAVAFCAALRLAALALKQSSLAFFALDHSPLRGRKEALAAACACFTCSIFTGRACVFWKPSAKFAIASTRFCTNCAKASRAASAFANGLACACSARCRSFSRLVTARFARRREAATSAFSPCFSSAPPRRATATSASARPASVLIRSASATSNSA